VILFLNGAFGIGKTTVARLLRRRIPHSAIYDPELAGLALQRLARLGGRDIRDFQDMRLWRSLTALGLRLTRLVRPNVIVPMAISDERVLGEFLGAAAALDSDVRHYCLVAPEDVVHARLDARGATRHGNAWEYRRAAECCVAHGSPAFAVQVDAAQRTPHQLADAIVG
jgi:hypothetical protein